VFASNQRDYTIVCQCSNPQCELMRRQIEGTGECTDEAVSMFSGLALRFERTAGKK